MILLHNLGKSIFISALGFSYQFSIFDLESPLVRLNSYTNDSLQKSEILYNVLESILWRRKTVLARVVRITQRHFFRHTGVSVETGKNLKEVTTLGVNGSRFIGQVVPVQWEKEPGFKKPLSFTWDCQVFQVQSILLKWEDHGFGQSPPKRRTWWLRRHRTYYHVLTSDKRVFELYYDRASKTPRWVLTKEL